ncbi:MAG: hypothetical protein CMI18_11295 [Opitutaceae bacterium]|nr:hypothetical protein [Opitutaceae bacterium]|tara:strand:- start:681 stop:905 length:225 start_codon:yes stop_codon:yes gene_type:complete
MRTHFDDCPFGAVFSYLFEFSKGLNNEEFNDTLVSSELSEGEGREILLTISFPFLQITYDFADQVEKGDLVNPW